MRGTYSPAAILHGSSRVLTIGSKGLILTIFNKACVRHGEVGMIVVDVTGFLPFAGKIAVSDKAGRFCIFDDNEGRKTEVPVNVRDAGYDETSGGAVYIKPWWTVGK